MSQSKLVGAPKGRRRRNEKKQNILECARYLIGTKLERFSIDVIVRKYKISNGTFYHYFSDRSEMMKELYILSSMQVVEYANILAERHYAGDRRVFLLSWIEVFAGEYVSDFAFYDAIFHDREIGCAPGEDPMVEYIDCALREIDRNEKEDLRNFMDMAVFILNGVERIVNRNVLHGVKEEIIKQSVTEIILSLVGPPFADVNAVQRAFGKLGLRNRRAARVFVGNEHDGLRH